MSDPITEEWLKEVGFKWHQLARQPEKQWLLWLGDVVRDGNGFTSHDDLGVEVAQVSFGNDERWHCWLRADYSGRYSRFIHTRHVSTQQDLITLIEGVTGQQWNPANNLYGSMRTSEQAERIRKDNERMDRRIMRERAWREIEKDDSRGGALPEHLDAYDKLDLKNHPDL
jgi:hypothetical protein